MRTSETPPAPDPRDARELTSGENADLCSGCVRCCSYLSIAIDSPRASWEYDQWIWALHHEKVALYVERPEQWFLHFETTCRQLDGQGRCSIHGRHPMLCREYDPRGCERRFPLSHQRAWFQNAEEFEAWLARERPAHWARLLAWRRDTVPSAPGASPGPPGSPPGTDLSRGRPSWIPLEALTPLAGGAPKRKSPARPVPAEAPLPVHEEL